MPVVRVVARVSASWEEVLSVDIPAGSTEQEADDLVAGVLDRADFELCYEKIEVDDWSWENKPIFAPQPPPVFPQDMALTVEWKGHRWATNGAVAIRDDAPCPTKHAFYTGWIYKSELTDLLDRMVLTLEHPLQQRYLPEHAPLLQAGEAYLAKSKHSEFCAVLNQNKEIVALIMPCNDRATGPKVDCRGTPCD